MPTSDRRDSKRGPGGIAELLGSDRVIRDRLNSALVSQRITLHGLSTLRGRYALTPAEASVFIAYYLGDPGISTEQSSIRRALAIELNLSENTLMHHITSIRRKLGISARQGSASVLLWSLSAGIASLETLAAGSPGDAETSWNHVLPA